jgi:hypothetical protein
VNSLAYTTKTNFIQYIVKRPIFHKPWKITTNKQMQEPTFDLINEQSKNSWMEKQEPSYLGAKIPRKIDKSKHFFHD